MDNIQLRIIWSNVRTTPHLRTDSDIRPCRRLRRRSETFSPHDTMSKSICWPGEEKTTSIWTKCASGRCHTDCFVLVWMTGTACLVSGALTDLEYGPSDWELGGPMIQDTTGEPSSEMKGGRPPHECESDFLLPPLTGEPMKSKLFASDSLASWFSRFCRWICCPRAV